jgi:shikimate 5-dehydrogenase
VAKKLKLIEITPQKFENRWKALQEILKRDCDTDLDVEIRECTHETLKANLSEVFKGDGNICRIDDVFVSEVLKHMARTTHEVNFSNSAGLLVLERGQWWPRPLYDQAFSKTISVKVGQIDLNSAALVIGAGGVSTLIVSSLVKMGFTTLNIADHDKDKGQAAVKELKKKFFKVKFDSIPTQNLTTLPGIHSIVVNTNPLDQKDELYAELYFFNFLKPGGVVIDLTLVPSRTPLIMEAEQWGARFLEGDTIAADRDCLMVEEILGVKIDPEAYRKSLRALIDAVPFDPGPYLKRFHDRAL